MLTDLVAPELTHIILDFFLLTLTSIILTFISRGCYGPLVLLSDRYSLGQLILPVPQSFH